MFCCIFGHYWGFSTLGQLVQTRRHHSTEVFFSTIALVNQGSNLGHEHGKSLFQVGSLADPLRYFSAVLEADQIWSFVHSPSLGHLHGPIFELYFLCQIEIEHKAVIDILGRSVYPSWWHLCSTRH